jgi:carbonic anhydrase
MTRRGLLAATCGLLYSAGSKSNHTVSSAQALRELQDGNRRFAANHLRHPHSSLRWVKQTAAEQHPHSLVLGCSDSRVPPEIVFDAGVGDIFSVRVAGNVANEDELASVEYAVGHLHVPLGVVLGHSHCGAVAAVLHGEKLPVEIQHLVTGIVESRAEVLEHGQPSTEAALEEAVIRANVFHSIQNLIRLGEPVRSAIRAKKFLLVGAIYRLESGKVDWLGEHPHLHP